MKSNQLFGPYGNSRYTAGNLNTAEGFIGQYNDGTGLDYFNARYYDPAAGVFLSADTAQGNAQGMNPYAYVNGDPSGRILTPVHGSGQPTVNVTLPATDPTTFPFWIPPVGALGSGAASTAVVNSAAATSIAASVFSKSGSDQGRDPVTSCGVPVTQATCSNFFANYAFYSPFGELSLPGLLCLICGGSGGSDTGGSFRENDVAFSSDAGTSSLTPEGQQLIDDPYAIQIDETQLTGYNPDARSAFASVLKRLEDLGGPLSNDLVATQAKDLGGNDELEGLVNGFQDKGPRGWRLDWDPGKEAHFNWYDWTNGTKGNGLGRWGAERFPATYEQVKDGILALPDIELMLIELES